MKICIHVHVHRVFTLCTCSVYMYMYMPFYVHAVTVCDSIPTFHSQISRLVDDIQRLQSNLSRLRDASSVQVRSLEEQLAQKTELIVSLELKLAGQSDYEEMKRELSVIKMVEFSTASSSPSLVGGVARDGTTATEGVSLNVKWFMILREGGGRGKEREREREREKERERERERKRERERWG